MAAKAYGGAVQARKRLRHVWGRDCNCGAQCAAPWPLCRQSRRYGSAGVLLDDLPPLAELGAGMEELIS